MNLNAMCYGWVQLLKAVCKQEMDMAHQYDVGDQVSLAFGFHDQNAVGLYTVTRRLPSLVNGEPQYRVKGLDDRERVIGEAQIDGPDERRNANWPARPRRQNNPITDMLDRLGTDKK